MEEDELFIQLLMSVWDEIDDNPRIDPEKEVERLKDRLEHMFWGIGNDRKDIKDEEHG